MSPLPRHVKPRILEALHDTRIVVLQGARQAGKTTLVSEIAADVSGRLVTLDDDLTRAAAEADPSGFLTQVPGGILAIDEVQRVPALVLALKVAVDRDPRPGRFLLTGCANLLRLPAMQDSLAGESLLGHTSSLTRQDYLERACAGSYPEALARTPGRRRAAWLDNYVQRIVERDAADVSRLQQLEELPRLLRMLAARNAGELNIMALANDVGMPARTLAPYLGPLETLFLVQRIPAWSTNVSKRVVSRPKATLLDTGLAARLVNVSAAGASVTANPDLAGRLLEGFVAGEIRRQLGWSEQTARLSHYPDHAGAEVDLVLETDDGRIAGVEVKATSSVTGRDATWLTQLRDRLGSRFTGGVVLHTGPTSAPFGDRIAALPMDVLWST
ncbi:MAG TPA: ATP-binding protein [Nocardioidaceae bacterium]|nr:ATP-binding protein [Nocardioidaceae bacterium]